MPYEILAFVREASKVSEHELDDDEWLEAAITQWTITNRKRLEELDDIRFHVIYSLGIELVLLHEGPRDTTLN